MHCLLIDDEESPRTLMSVLIRRDGHTVTTAETGAQAIDIVGSQRVDLAIVDMELPGLDGASTIAELRRLNPDIKILVVSGHSERRYVLGALEAGAHGYLLKDEIREYLSAGIADIEAGYTLLSPRVATETLRKLLRTLGRPLVEAQSSPRSQQSQSEP